MNHWVISAAACSAPNSPKFTPTKRSAGIFHPLVSPSHLHLTPEPACHPPKPVKPVPTQRPHMNPTRRGCGTHANVAPAAPQYCRPSAMFHPANRMPGEGQPQDEFTLQLSQISLFFASCMWVKRLNSSRSSGSEDRGPSAVDTTRQWHLACACGFHLSSKTASMLPYLPRCRVQKV